MNVSAKFLKASLRAAGVSESVITQVTRYFGLKGQAACNAVAAYTVVLSNQDALDLSNKIITQGIHSNLTYWALTVILIIFLFRK